MDLIQAFILGIIQGLTEFLPVSSSGHLVLTRHLFGLTDPDLFFDTSVHVGTMLAVLLVFRKTIFEILQALISAAGNLVRRDHGMVTPANKAGLRLALMVVAGAIPTAVIGLAFEATLIDHFASLSLVGAMLLVTAATIWLTRGRGQVEDTLSRIPIARVLFLALVVGGVQGLAVLPGVSRSGVTIAAGLFLGLDRNTAARYSFLLSIPAIVGAEILSAKDLVGQAVTVDGTVLLGTVTAFGVGFLALTILLKLVRQGRLHLFAPYCLVVGLAALAAAVW